MTHAGDTYTFGTTPVAGARLRLLAELYEPDSRALLARWCPPRVERAVDLGSGPGHTTVLLHEVSGAAHTVGVERSESFVRAARTEAPEGVTYLIGDVTRDDLPLDPADVVHARFLLTHLSAPRSALRIWADLVRPGGRLVLHEVARLVSSEPALGRYYELVAELQAHHGQALEVGRDLAAIAEEAGLVVEHAVVRAHTPPTAAMAALHVLNLRSWRTDRYASGAFDADELDALDDALSAIAHGAPSEPIEQDLAEVVISR